MKYDHFETDTIVMHCHSAICGLQFCRTPSEKKKALITIYELKRALFTRSGKNAPLVAHYLEQYTKDRTYAFTLYGEAQDEAVKRAHDNVRKICEIIEGGK